MSFCPHCGHSFEPSAEPKGQCPACGKLLAAPVSVPDKPGTIALTTRKTVKPSRYKIDVVIALVVVVFLILLCRLINRPKILGSTGGTILTNVFGPAGMSLAQAMGLGNGGGDSAEATPGASDTRTNGTATNQTVPTGQATNLNQRSNAVAMDDSIISTQAVEAIMGSGDGEPSTNSADAVAMAQRLGEVGAKSGDIEFSLSWNNVNDLDLHCIDPKGVHIWFSNTNSPLSGGKLDHDANAHDFVNTPVENIYWPVGGAPAGIYEVSVVFYSNHGGQIPTPFTVRTVVKDQTNYFRGALYPDDMQRHLICTIQYDPGNPDPAKRRRFLNPGQRWSNFH